LAEEGGPRHAFTVAPRGAAQRVYGGEVRRRRDPALLEQIGPRQYRLRAFPIPPRPRHDEHGARPQLMQAPRFHLWLRVALLAEGGVFPLPRLGERRGVCWDRATRRIAPARDVAWPQESWLPAELPLRESVPPAARSFDFDLGGERLT